MALPTLTKEEVIENLLDDILIHEQWACYVVEYPEYAESMGDYDWHIRWIKIYENAIYYLENPLSPVTPWSLEFLRILRILTKIFKKHPIGISA